MGTISVTLPSDGDTIDASDVNNPFNTIVNLVNGNLDTDNLSADAGITATQLNFGGSGSGVWWEEIGRTTLAGAGDTITVSSLAPRKYLKILIDARATGGNINLLLQFNNDSSTNYARRYSDNGAADTTATSQTSVGLIDAVGATPVTSVCEVENITTAEKLVLHRAIRTGTAGSGNAPARREGASKWANTAAQISRVDLVNDSTGDFAIGSEVIVLGHD